MVRNVVRAASLLLLLGVLGACAPAATPSPGPAPGTEPVRLDLAAVRGTLSPAHTRFGFKLLRELARQEGQDNLVLSPPSVAFALAMTHNGARGETREAMARTLELAGLSLEEVNAAHATWLELLTSADPEVHLHLANALWFRQGVPVLPEFTQRNADYYGAQVADLDFSRADAPDVINAWVRRATEERIEGIVDGPISPDTFMFLVNALYFQGDWSSPFPSAATRDGAFTLADGTVVQVPMMSRTGRYAYLRGDGFQAVRIPYGEGRFAMEVLLPDEEVGLEGLLARMDADTWEGWMDGYQSRTVALSLPRFTVRYEASLDHALSALGMAVAFDEGAADFTGMVPAQWLGPRRAYIKEVKHKTYLNVHEAGTEAAAVTSVEVGVTSAPTDLVRLTVDRPFFLAIRDAETRTVLFVGTVWDPS